MLEIDGSFGEGGGQIIRTAIALSSLTKKPIKIKNIRAKRKNPGLAYQHITAIKLVGKICNAKVKGLDTGSSSIEFYPNEIKGGDYNFDVGTAGSITLILQACLPPSLFAKEKSIITIKGGTDVMWSPPIDYFANVFLPLVKKMGTDIKVKLLQRGHYPKGGGKVRIEISPIANNLSSLSIEKRGKILQIRGIAHAVNLPNHVVERMKNSTLEKLKKYNVKIGTELSKGYSSGAGIVLFAEFENTVLGSSALGEIGVRAEIVGEKAGNALLKEINSKSTLDIYAADQILPYLALAKNKSSFLAREISLHAKTNMWLIQKFLDVEFQVFDEKGIKKVVVS